MKDHATKEMKTLCIDKIKVLQRQCKLGIVRQKFFLIQYCDVFLYCVLSCIQIRMQRNVTAALCSPIDSNLVEIAQYNIVMKRCKKVVIKYTNELNKSTISNRFLHQNNVIQFHLNCNGDLCVFFT